MSVYFRNCDFTRENKNLAKISTYTVYGKVLVDILMKTTQPEHATQIMLFEEYFMHTGVVQLCIGAQVCFEYKCLVISMYFSRDIMSVVMPASRFFLVKGGGKKKWRGDVENAPEKHAKICFLDAEIFKFGLILTHLRLFGGKENIFGGNCPPCPLFYHHCMMYCKSDKFCTIIHFHRVCSQNRQQKY